MWFIQKHEQKIIWDHLFSHCSMRVILHYIELILNFPNVQPFLSYNPNITFDFIKKHSDFKWNWYIVSRNPNVSMDDIQSNPDFPWKWDFVLKNQNITIDFIERDLSRWDWRSMCFCPNLTPEFIAKYIDQDWNWDWLSRHKAITYELFQSNIHKKWDLNWIIYHTEIGLKKDPNLTVISSNPHAKISDINKVIRRMNIFQLYQLSFNPNLTEEFVQKHENVWNYDTLSYNKIITPKFVDKNIHKRWNWNGISHHPMIDLKFVEKYHDKLNWRILSLNEYEKEICEITVKYYTQRKKKTHEMNEMIEEELIIYTWHPSRYWKWCLDEDEKKFIENFMIT
jgi:hypothetical protein